MSVRKTRNFGLSQSSASEHIQRATARVFNEATLKPSLVVSPYINAWLEEHSRVYMHDPVGLLQYILSLASFLGEDNYIYRNNRQSTPTTLFLSLCTRPAYGKSDLFHATKDSIINLLCVRQGLGAYARSDKRKRKANIQMPDLNAFADELTRLGLLTALEKAPRLLLFDELDQLFVRNGLIPLANAAQNENNNFYEIALQLYSDNCLFSKHTSTTETTFQSNRVCIMGNHTQEPCTRMASRKLNGECPNAFFERHLMLCARTPVTQEKLIPDIFNYKKFASIDQLSMTLSFLVALDFFFNDEGRSMSIGFSNSLTREMRDIEAFDSWLCARLGKSREHVLRVSACIQLLELAFYLMEKYRLQYDGFDGGLADDQFYQRMLNIVSEFLKREPMIKHEDRIKSDPVAIEVHNDVVRGAINYVQIIIRQYRLLFIDLDETMNLNNNNNPLRKQQVTSIPNTKATNLCSMVQINNQSNINTYQDDDDDDDNQFLYSSLSNDMHDQNHPCFTKKGLKFAKHFLTYDSWILTNKCINSTMRHNTALKNEVLHYLINYGYLCEIKGGLKHRNIRGSAIDIWVKCMPSSNTDFETIRRWNSQLLIFGVTWKQYASTLSNIRIIDALYMSDALNEYILANYSTINLFISNDTLFKIAPPDTNNAGIEDETSLSASKTTFELYNDMDEQEECVENVQLSDQDDEDEEKSLCDEDTMDSNHQQQLLARSSSVNNLSINSNFHRETSRSSFRTSNASVAKQLKTSEPKQSIINNKKKPQSMLLNMAPKATTTLTTEHRCSINNTSSYSNQQMQQQSIRSTNTNKTTGFGSNNFHQTANSPESTRTALELMSTRLLQSEYNRKTVGKNNSTNKKK